MEKQKFNLGDTVLRINDFLQHEQYRLGKITTLTIVNNEVLYKFTEDEKGEDKNFITNNDKQTIKIERSNAEKIIKKLDEASDEMQEVITIKCDELDMEMEEFKTEQYKKYREKTLPTILNQFNNK